MLNKRTHILFDQETFITLQMIARKDNTSIGDLVRTAVQKIYCDMPENQWERKKQAFEELKKWRSQFKPFKGRIDYKALIEDGRKY